MTSRRNRRAARIVAAISTTLVAHAIAIALFALFGGFDVVSLPPSQPLRSTAQNGPEQKSATEDDRPMEIESIVDQLDRPDEKSEAEKKREEEAKKEEEQTHPNGQVVDIARPTVEQRPDKSNYLAEYDSKVDHETRGATGHDRAGSRAEAAPPLGMPDVTRPQPGESSRAPSGPVGKPGLPGPLAMRELERRRAAQQPRVTPGPQATSDGELERAGSPQQNPAARPVERPDQPSPGQNGEGGAGRGAQQAAVPGLPGGRADLTPSKDLLQHAIGKGAGSMDWLKDVDDGEATAVNAKKWKHAPFFNRLSRAVGQEWHPEPIYMIHDPSGRVYGKKDRVTIVRVHLSPDGKLAGWQILQSCGADFLDDEAVAAFQRAAPFPNPPKDLVEADGQIHFNFGFIFELSGRTSTKIYKYQ